jgi:acid phosphatase family membrane protein YuiD
MDDGFEQFLNNSALWASVAAWAVAQSIKVLVELVRTRKVNVALFISSGGMPSSHSAFVMAMTTSVGVKDGLDSAIFAVSAVLSLVVMYDAAGVRRAAGRHAALINTIIENIENSGVRLDKKLKELLGHSPLEVVAGAVLGIIVAVLCLNAL